MLIPLTSKEISVNSTSIFCAPVCAVSVEYAGLVDAPDLGSSNEVVSCVGKALWFSTYGRRGNIETFRVSVVAFEKGILNGVVAHCLAVDMRVTTKTEIAPDSRIAHDKEC